MSSISIKIIKTSNALEILQKNLHEHIRAFLMLCKIISHGEMSADAFRMYLFPHTLKDGTREWLYSLAIGNIMSCNDMVKKFRRSSFHHLKFIKFWMKSMFSSRRTSRAIQRHGRSSRTYLKSLQILIFISRWRYISSTMDYDQDIIIWQMLHQEVQW